MAKPPLTTVYVVDFSDEIVKVGVTSNMMHRLGWHSSAAKRRGVTINDFWSHKVDNAGRIEAELIAMAHQRGTIAWGAEFFKGIVFREFVTEIEAAYGWPLTRTREWDDHVASYVLSQIVPLPK